MLNKKENSKKEKENEIVSKVKKEFEKRQEERKSFDAQWQLNLNFVMGNQFCGIGSNDTLDDFDKQYFWQEREVYNHIAPLIETRLSKLTKVRPIMTVLPASGDEDDINKAHISKDILSAVSSKLELSKVVGKATLWSEICGTVFYKIVWNTTAGSLIGLTEFGEKIKEGDVDVVVCPPFEIYPDSNSAEGIEFCKSIIHARPFHIDTIKNRWGVEVKGEDIDTYNLSNSQLASGLGYVSKSAKLSKLVKHDNAMVIEKYDMPDKENPKGKLTIIAGDKLLYDGDLPYLNQQDGERGFPFVRQVGSQQPTLFWGSSIVERSIPVQRAYNAVKNRKHEMMNRLCMGVLAVEDGSVDIDNLEEEGLCPGKVLVYRQGANIPRLMNAENVPTDFTIEEERLLNEFLNISGVSDLFGSNASVISNMSGVALQILLEQEDMRVSATGENIKFAIKQIGQHILRLYRQFANNQRISRVIGINGDSKLFYWDKTAINSEEIVFETDNELGQTVAQKRSMIMDLLNAGLLHDENGKLSNSMRLKVLENLGFGIWENSLDCNNLQVEKAKREDIQFVKGDIPEVLEIHDHDLHINTHTAFMLSGEFDTLARENSKIRDNMLEHIRQHKMFKKLSNIAENNSTAV